MKTYNEFHGELPLTEIGKRLREIIKKEKTSFKILTGYGSTCGRSLSKENAIKSLKKLKSEGLIKAFLPGEIKTTLLTSNSPYYEDKNKYGDLIKNDKDYGNDGVIFVII